MRNGTHLAHHTSTAPQLRLHDWLVVRVWTRPNGVNVSLGGDVHSISVPLPSQGPRFTGVMHTGNRTYFRDFDVASAERGLTVGGDMGVRSSGARVRVAVVRRYSVPLTSRQVNRNFRAEVARFRTSSGGSKTPDGNNGTSAPVPQVVAFQAPPSVTTNPDTLLGRFAVGTTNHSRSFEATTAASGHAVGAVLGPLFKPAVVEAVSFQLAARAGKPPQTYPDAGASRR